MRQIIIGILALGIMGCAAHANSGKQFNKNRVNQTDSSSKFDDTQASTIGDDVKQGLLYMWEEEKLARDIYELSYSTYGRRVFGNISRSEQRHMNAIANLLEKYGIEKPVDENQRGVFSVPEIKRLYEKLKERSLSSEYEALLVGKDIEELDIADLNKQLETATQDLKHVYSNLLNASYRHLNAFNRNLNR